MTQLTFNIKKFNIIKTTSFFANFKRNFNSFNYKESSMLTNVTKLRIDMMKQIHDNIMKMQIKSTIYQNTKKKMHFYKKRKIKCISLRKIF